MRTTTRTGEVCPRRGIRRLGLTLALVGWAVPSFSASPALSPDPVGDTLGGAGRHDLTSLSAERSGDETIVALTFAAPIEAPDSGHPDALAGFVDLDTDGRADTGRLPLVDFMTPFASGLGSERYLALGTYRGDDQAVDLVADGADGSSVLGRVPMTLAPNALEVRVPHALLGASAAVRLAAVVGTQSAVTDAAPNGGFVLEGDGAAGEEVLLQGGRFAVEVSWRDAQDRRGVGRLATRSPDTAVFWFFRDTNWELMLKVLDGCVNNGHYWVFAAATTNVAYTLKVTDTATGGVRVYANPLGTSAAAVTDNKAFATCP